MSFAISTISPHIVRGATPTQTALLNHLLFLVSAFFTCPTLDDTVGKSFGSPSASSPPSPSSSSSSSSSA